MSIDDNFIHSVLQEVQGPEENDRRASAKKRHDIYRDGGREFLIEQLGREFGQDAIAEMRLTPINFLKKIVNSLGSVYKRSPVRYTEDSKDQILVDYYSKRLDVNTLMQKANRYLVLAANTIIYVRPWQEKDGTWCLKAQVTPNYLYSLVPEAMDQTQINTVVFSAYVEEGRITPLSALPPATGVQGYSQERGFKTSGDLVASNERQTDLTAEQYIFWSDDSHVTTNASGARLMVPEEGEEQFINPIGKMPVVILARDRDNQPWSTEGEDLIDLTMALQLGWTDCLSIAKHQGYSMLTLISEEEPKKLVIGLNRALWLKVSPNSPVPSVSYVSPNSPLDQYTEMLDKLTKLLLTTNNMDPGSVGGDAKSQQFTSGFHALISMSDNLAAVENDKPTMANAETEFWELISRWHNWMYDNGMLDEEAGVLGKFSEEFKIHVMFPDVRPLESEDEKINRIKLLTDMGLITKKQALKKLHPDATDEQIDAIMQEIAEEKQSNMDRAKEMMSSVEEPEDMEEMDAAEEGQEQESDQS